MTIARSQTAARQTCDGIALRKPGPLRGCWAVLLLATAGCQFLGRAQPAPQHLLNCRQLTQRAKSAMDRGDWDKAETLLAEAIRSCPVDTDARQNYAEVLWRRGDQTQAAEQLAEAVRLSPEDAALLVRLAELRLQAGQVDAALEGASLAVDLHPRLPAAWGVRGAAWRRRGDPRRALADFHRALALQPDCPVLLVQTAETYRELGEPQRALACLNGVLENCPADEEPQHVLMLAGAACMALGRYDDALENFSLARDRGPESAGVLFRLAEAQLLAGRWAQADAAARQALSLDPRHAGSQALLRHLAAVPAASSEQRR